MFSLQPPRHISTLPRAQYLPRAREYFALLRQWITSYARDICQRLGLGATGSRGSGTLPCCPSKQSASHSSVLMSR